ncbi:hypothetical protein [Tahibacter harae]|uniref:Uncharacterized protein n=1 Tax=Tahibacter harae TaxID=2963937 RepID=A0ABT1QW60_9GAMM|nr:hypothetical protein [Tahibacter harae]MCQ4166517.1 hypothetical protein [Tahibacter harae]
MPDYRLQLLIDPADLNVIRAAGQRITLAKPVNSDSSPNVVWLSIDPFQSTEVQWAEEYGIYASTTAVQQGASITKLSETGVPAQDGATYSFTAGATFNGPFGGGVPRGTYGAQNDMPNSNYPMLTFGLTQSALINQKPVERKPISATPVLATQFASMTPFTSVYIWLQSQFASETIITKIVGRTSKARFGGGVTDLSLKYDAGLGVFVPVSAAGKAVKADHDSVEISAPQF